jgi:hypothetical protein
VRVVGVGVGIAWGSFKHPPRLVLALLGLGQLRSAGCLWGYSQFFFEEEREEAALRPQFGLAIAPVTCFFAVPWCFA